MTVWETGGRTLGCSKRCFNAACVMWGVSGYRLLLHCASLSHEGHGDILWGDDLHCEDKPTLHACEQVHQSEAHRKSMSNSHE